MIDDYRTQADLLCRPLGLVIQDATRTDTGGLALSMSDGARIEIGIHTSKYESVVLYIGDKTIVG